MGRDSSQNKHSLFLNRGKIFKPTEETSLYILTFFLFLLIFLTTMNGYFDIPDTMPSFKTAKSIIEKGRLDLEITETIESKLISDVTPGPASFTYFRAKDGKIYSKYGLAVAAYMIPFVLVGKFLYLIAGHTVGASQEFFEKFAVSSMSCFPMALACVFLVKLARKTHFSFTVAFILAVFFGLGTMAWYYADSTFSEGLLTFELLGAVYFMLKAYEAKRRSDMAISALFVGMLILTKIATLIVLPILFIYILYVGIKDKNKELLITFFAIVAFFLGLLAWLNFIRFGNILETGYGRELSVKMSQKPLILAIYRYILSPHKGLFVYNPLLIASLFALHQYYKKQRNLFYITLGMFTIYLIAFSVSSFRLFVSWGPRYLIILIPYLVLPIGYLLEKKKNMTRVLIALLFLLSFSISLTSVLVPHSEFRYIKILLQKTPIKYPPPDINGAFALLKNKLGKKDEIYTGRDFGITLPEKSDITMDLYKYSEFRGFNLWYLYLERKTGYRHAKIFPFISLPLALLALIKICALIRRLDKNLLPV